MTQGSSILGAARWLVLVVCALGLGCVGQSRVTDEPVDPPSATEPLTIAFEANTTLTARELERTIEVDLDDYESSGWRASFVNDAAYALESTYRSEGFASARVTYAIQETAAGRHIVFTIFEGPRAELVRLEIDGVERYDLERVEALFEFPQAPGNGAAARYFSRSALSAGRSKLQGIYASDGHLEVRISDDVLISEEGDWAEVRVFVDEGPAYVLENVELTFQGGEVDLRFEADWNDELGRAYTPRLEVQVRKRIEERLANAGRVDARVQSDALVNPDGSVRLDVRVEPGAIVHVGEIKLRGALKPSSNRALGPADARRPATLDAEDRSEVGERRTLDSRASFIRDRLTLGSGDAYRSAELRDSFARLYATGLFRRVELDLDTRDQWVDGQLRRDLLVTLDEVPSQDIFIEPGFGSYELLRIRAGWRERSIFGTGRTLRIQGLAAQRATGAEIGLTDPHFLGETVSADLSVSFDERERPSFTRQESGAQLVLTWPWSKQLQFSAEYSFRNSRVFDVEVDPPSSPELTDALEDVDISSILVGPRFDTRDRLFVPNRGVFARLGVEWAASALGSEVDFLRSTLTTSVFLPMPAEVNTVLGLTFQAGVVAPLGSTDVIPIQERFFLGGSNAVRSFEEDALGPSDATNSPLGGEAFSLFSVELRRKLMGNLHGGVFYDAGMVLPQIEDVSDPTEWRGGPGVGLRYLLPVGPIRVDLGWNPDPRDNEPEFVTHLAVGMAF